MTTCSGCTADSIFPAEKEEANLCVTLIDVDGPDRTDDEDSESAAADADVALVGLLDERHRILHDYTRVSGSHYCSVLWINRTRDPPISPRTS
mgnify:CR=1 FL=1